MELLTPVLKGEKRERDLGLNLCSSKKRPTSIDFYDDDMKINEIELFLKNNKSSNITSKSLTIFDLNYGKEKYEELVKINGSHYVTFGYNAHGFIFFSMYKSKNNKIYILKLTLKAIHSYIEIKDSMWFNS
jgi:hypothetical protein